MGADVPSLGLSNKAVLEGDQSVPEVDKHVKDQYPDFYFKPDAYDKPPTEDTLVQNTLWPEIQKVKKDKILKINRTGEKSYFTETVYHPKNIFITDSLMPFGFLQWSVLCNNY